MNDSALLRAKIYNRAVLYFNEHYKNLETLIGINFTKLLDDGYTMCSPELALMREDGFEFVVEVSLHKRQADLDDRKAFYMRFGNIASYIAIDCVERRALRFRLIEGRFEPYVSCPDLEAFLF